MHEVEGEKRLSRPYYILRNAGDLFMHEVEHENLSSRPHDILPSGKDRFMR